ncbi:MAG: hypothetical protein ACHQD9_03225 [Chitinophagales bacterium]
MKEFFSYFILSATLILISASRTSAQQPATVSVQLDSAGYRIGDYIGLTISISHPYEVQTGMDSIEKRLGNQFDVIRQVSDDSIKQKDFLTEQKKYLITTFDTGWLRIPPIVVFYKSSAGKWDSALSDPLPVYVGTVSVDASKGMRPIKPILMNENNFPWQWILGAAFILLAACSFYYWYRMQLKKRKLRNVKVEPVKSPYERAKEKLNQLEKEKLWRKERVEEYYLRLTHILREYIEETLRIPALEITTAEMLRALRKNISDDVMLDQLKRDLLLADFVKFAQLEPAVDEHERVMNTIVQFIEKTKPVTTEKPEVVV